MNSEQSDKDVFKGYMERKKMLLANSALTEVYITVLPHEKCFILSVHFLLNINEENNLCLVILL